MAKQKTPGKKPQSKNTEDPKPKDGEEENEEEENEEEEEEDPQEQNRRINAIVTSRVKRELKGITAELATVKGLLEKLANPKEEEEEGKETPGEEGKEETDSKTAKKLTRLERQLAEEREARKAAEKSREEEADKAKRSEMKNLYASILTEYGCTDPNLNRAALVILEENGIMVRDENDKIKFKGADKWGVETLLDPKVGLKTWIAGDGKSFVPAIDAGGSGTGGTGQGLGNTKFTSKDLKNLTPKQIAEINFDRAFTGQPALPTEGDQG